MLLAGAFGRCLCPVPLAVTIVCIVICRFPCADCVRVLLCGFSYADYAEGIAQWRLRSGVSIVVLIASLS